MSDDNYEPKQTRKQLKRKKQLDKYSDGYDSDFYGDDDDIKKLNQMNEIDKQNELSRRYEQRQQYLKKKKMQKQEPKTRTQKKHKKKISSSSSDYEIDQKKQTKQPQVIQQQHVIQQQNNIEEENKLEDLQQALKSITLTRNYTKNILKRHVFEEAVKDCYVRISIPGQGTKKQFSYVFAQIIEVINDKEYEFEGVKTTKHFKLQYGQKQTIFKLTYLSNSPTVYQEILDWQQKNQQNGIRMPTVQQIKNKEKTLKEILQKERNSEEIEKEILDKLIIHIQKIDNKQEIDLAENNNYIEFLNNKNSSLEYQVFIENGQREKSQLQQNKQYLQKLKEQQSKQIVKVAKQNTVQLQIPISNNQLNVVQKFKQKMKTKDQIRNELKQRDENNVDNLFVDVGVKKRMCNYEKSKEYKQQLKSQYQLFDTQGIDLEIEKWDLTNFEENLLKK